ncbi:hypothetical protein [Thermobispora bispora]|uniref:Uncharacterized protein n=1 Tax=Thermobispora bispora (strain ATCC 19993 / DSM 43833 / CBS 139.67 / JCM 10125 / KCTC 9307 / NBRC 14880 / R51) TaxID=469371 RepID=D6Y7H1_THEBD|nr:hypothetical protein [Thermobispora bispora]ADG89682.1 hypothetical protein Tbis_2984 [Thermobispora bispora DSM 43833]
MPKVNKFVGVLAMSAALTGGAVALGTAATTVAADAATVSAVQMQNPHAFVLKRKKKGAKKKNKNKQWQREQQHQKQNQFLLRDFTLVLTPFQKSENDSRALPYNWQYGQTQSIPWSQQRSFVENENKPRDEQRTKVKPEQEIEREQVLLTPTTTPGTPIPAVTVTVTASPIT